MASWVWRAGDVLFFRASKTVLLTGSLSQNEKGSVYISFSWDETDLLAAVECPLALGKEGSIN